MKSSRRLAVVLVLMSLASSSAPPVQGQAGPETGGSELGFGILQASAQGLPIDSAAIEALPSLIKVPILPPNSGNVHFEGLPKFPQLPAGNMSGRQAGTESATVAATLPTTPFQPVTQFIYASGDKFMQGPNQSFYFAGTNSFNLIDASAYSKSSVYNSLVQHWNAGARVIRIFAFNNGNDNGYSKMPIQDPVGVFHEDALQRYDYVVATAGAIGIRLILCLHNHWKEYNGNQWYVDQTLGPGHDLEEFYTAPKPRAAYKKWVSTIIGRTNTVNGRQYRTDPTIFAWETCNECHTWDFYETSRNMTPGQLLYNWEVEMVQYFRRLNITQMLTNGAEGYRAKGTYDPHAPTTYPFNCWISVGQKGEDFVRNLGISGFDFFTIHAGVCGWNNNDPSTDIWFDKNFVGNRAGLVHQITGKPVIVEETGTKTSYGNRDFFLSSYFAAANRYNYAGTLVWAAHANVPETTFLLSNGTWGYEGYNFLYSQSGGLALKRQAEYMNSRSGGCASCSDNIPGSFQDAAVAGKYTCAQQAAIGACETELDWMVEGDGSGDGGYCQITCGRCPNCAPPVACQDLVPPCNGEQCYTCAQQAAWGACFEGWMVAGNGTAGGYCAATCGRCIDD